MNKRELQQVREYSVIKRNDLIQKSKYNLTATEQKIVWFLISKIKFEDKDLETYDFEINEFCEVCGIEKRSGSNYEHVKTSIKTLADKSFWMPTAEGSIPLIRWIESPVIEPNSGTIKLKLNPYLKPYLIDIKVKYTTATFKIASVMSGLYTIRVYELLKSYAGLGKCDFDLDDYAEKIDAIEYTKSGTAIGPIYTPYDFKRHVIEKTLKQINKYSEISVTYVMGKTGNRYTRVYYTIMEKVGPMWYDSDLMTDKALNKRRSLL